MRPSIDRLTSFQRAVIVSTWIWNVRGGLQRDGSKGGAKRIVRRPRAPTHERRLNCRVSRLQTYTGARLRAGPGTRDPNRRRLGFFNSDDVRTRWRAPRGEPGFCRAWRPTELANRRAQLGRRRVRRGLAFEPDDAKVVRTFYLRIVRRA